MQIRSNLLKLAVMAGFCGLITASDDSQFTRVFIQQIKNLTQANCTVEDKNAYASHQVKLSAPLEIPFISIKKYLRQFASKTPYTPQEALKIETPNGQYRLWSSESGVMLARNPNDNRLSLDNWKAKKILSNNKNENGGKNLALATLIFKFVRNKKFTVALEETPARS